MAYICELATGQTLILDNPNGQTVITTASRQSGQQQQSSQSFASGPWTALPELFALAAGVAIRLTTAQGEHWIQIQGGQLSRLSPPANPGQPLPLSGPIPSPAAAMPPMTPIAPMTPMPPMTMGNLQANPMAMQMGNMAMQMGTPMTPMAPMAPITPITPVPMAPIAPVVPPQTPPGQSIDTHPPAAASAPKFCSQCGAGLRSGDRFCSSCGHAIG